MAPIAGTTLSFAVNTNWDVFVDTGDEDVVPAEQRRLARGARREGSVDAGRRAAAVVRGAARPTRNFADVKKQIPGTRVHRAETRRPYSCRPRRPRSSSPAGRRSSSRFPARRCSTSRTPTPRCSATRATAASTTSCRAAGSRRRASTGRGRTRRRACPPDFARIPAERPARLRAGVGARHAAGAGSAARGADSTAGARSSRDTAKLDVVYAGAPQFEPIAGTPM